MNLLPVGKYVPKLLEKRGVIEKLIRIHEDSYDESLELVFDEAPKKMGFAAAYRDMPFLAEYASTDTVAGKKKYGKTIIVDKLVFYVPYHLKPRDYGIYFRANRIEKDFKKFAHFVYIALKNKELAFLKEEFPARWVHFRTLIDRPREFIVSLFIGYISHVYFHALTHHIIEDISTYLELIRKGKYSPVRSINEEKFAEWVAFKALESYRVPEVLYQSKKVERLINIFSYMLPPANPDRIVDITFAMSSLLYVHFRSFESVIYAPEVTHDIARYFSIIWEVMKSHHFTLEIEPLILPYDNEIFTRIFLTKY